MKAANLLWCVVLLVSQPLALSEPPPLTPFPSTIGKPAAEVVAIVGTKLTHWKREPAELHAAQGSVRFKRDETELLVQVKNGKIAGTAIAGTTDDAGKAREKEAREALRVASEVVKTAAPAAGSPESIAARQKQHLEALVKEGFTRAEAVQIVAASQSAAAPAPVE